MTVYESISDTRHGGWRCSLRCHDRDLEVVVSVDAVKGIFPGLDDFGCAGETSVG